MNDYSLTSTELAMLHVEHKRMKRLNDARKADRIKAVYLLGNGWRVEDIKEALLIDENTIYRYYNLHKEFGLKGLLNNKYKGREPELNDKQLCELEALLQQQPCRTSKEVVELIKEEFDIVYSISGAVKLLKRLDFVYKKPQPVPGKYDKDEQRKFITKYRKIRRNMGEDDSLFFIDGVHPHHNPTLQRGWFKRGSEIPVKTGTRFGSLNITGAIDIDSLDVFTQESKRLTEETTLDFIFMLRRKRPKGWIYLVLDNAGYYNTERIRDAAKKLAIKLIYLPPYSPNLNLIERLWNYMRQHFLYNRYFKTLGEFKESCLQFFRDIKNRKNDLRGLMTEKFQVFA